MMGIRIDAVKEIVEGKRLKYMRVDTALVDNKEGLGKEKSEVIKNEQMVKNFRAFKNSFDSVRKDQYLSILTDIQILMSNNPSEPPAQEFIESDLMPYILQFLTNIYYTSEDHLYQALW